jgi:hypothetical protein
LPKSSSTSTPAQTPTATPTLTRLLAGVPAGGFKAAVQTLSEPAWATLESLFWNAAHPMPPPARAAFGEYVLSVQLLWQKVGIGGIRPLTVFRSTLSSAEGLDAALRLLAKIYAGSNLGYAAPPPGFWRSLYAITGYVLAQREKSPNTHLALQDLCLQIWLMAWLNPLSLAAGRLPVAAKLVALLSKTCSYSLAPPTHSGSGLAAADLMDDKPPMPFARIAPQWAPQLPVYVNAQDAAFAIEEIRASAGGASVQSDLYDGLLATGQSIGLTAQEVHDFVRRAVREFGQSQVRTIPRVTMTGTLECGFGLVEVWNAMLEQTPTAAQTSKNKLQTFAAKILNKSDGGFLLKLHLEQPLIRTGSLVCMRSNKNDPWTVGIVRWLQDSSRDVLVGCEILSNFGESRVARIPDSQRQLPMISYEHKDQIRVFVPLGTGEPQTVTELKVDNESWVLAGTQELGADWELRGVLDIGRPEK